MRTMPGQSAVSDDTLLFALKLTPIRRRRFKVECRDQSRRLVGRRYKLTCEQLACITCAKCELAKLNESHAFVGIWREASEHRDAAAFVARFVAEVECVRGMHALGRGGGGERS